MEKEIKQAKLAEPLRQWGEAGMGFLADTLMWQVVGSTVRATVSKLFKKNDFTSSFKTSMTNKLMWSGSLLLGVYGGYDAWKTAKQEQKEYSDILGDNIEMRSQLNQTGQILRHVASEVEKGHLKESELTINEDAPPSHVVKLEVQQAAREAQAALAKG